MIIGSKLTLFQKIFRCPSYRNIFAGDVNGMTKTKIEPFARNRTIVKFSPFGQKVIIFSVVTFGINNDRKVSKFFFDLQFHYNTQNQKKNDHQHWEQKVPVERFVYFLSGFLNFRIENRRNLDTQHVAGRRETDERKMLL